jgi:hypothetical protein
MHDWPVVNHIDIYGDGIHHAPYRQHKNWQAARHTILLQVGSEDRWMQHQIKINRDRRRQQ